MDPNELNNQLGQLQGIPWAEYISQKAGSTASMALSYGQGAQAVMTFDFHWEDFDDFVEKVLGYPERVGAGIVRHLPIAHPLRANWYASRITQIQGIQFTDKMHVIQSIPGARYTLLRATVLFEARNYRVLSDTQLALRTGNPPDESYRWTFAQRRPCLETISREGGEFWWADGFGTGFGVTAPTVNIPIPGRTSQTLRKEEITFTWYQVPKLYLQDSSDRPLQLEVCHGTVNDAAFLGYPPGTLLLETYEIDPEPAPVRHDALGAGFPWFEPAVVLNAVLHLKYFDPPPGNTANRGWNLAPHTDGLWWLIKTSGTGAPLYPYTTFKNMFLPAT